jgi:hypothetical protein
MLWARMVYRRGHTGGHALIACGICIHTAVTYLVLNTYIVIHTEARGKGGPRRTMADQDQGGPRRAAG